MMSDTSIEDQQCDRLLEMVAENSKDGMITVHAEYMNYLIKQIKVLTHSGHQSRTRDQFLPSVAEIHAMHLRDDVGRMITGEHWPDLTTVQPELTTVRPQLTTVKDELTSVRPSLTTLRNEPN